MKKIQQNLLRWFKNNARKLPWRQTYSPYHVWISEIMLQQTQMDRAVSYFNNWISHFPDIKSITRASEEKILKFWEGLGYYSRARNIHKTARLLVENYNGRLPEDHKALLELPGIGPYTAGAIMSIAFNREYPLVDANVERVFARLFDLDKQTKDRDVQKFIWNKASEMIPPGKARDFNQAIMELGDLICFPQNPRCHVCPVKEQCKSFDLCLVKERPVLKNPPKTIFIEMATGILEVNNRLFIQKRKTGGVWPNLWEFPGGRLELGETPEMALVREYKEETELSIGNLKKIISVQHSYTIYRVTLHCYFCSLMDDKNDPILHGAQEYRWIAPSELDQYAFPAGHRKLIDHLFHSGYFSNS